MRFTEDNKLKVEGGGEVDWTGPEGLLRAIFGYSPRDIQYPLPRVSPTSDLPVRPTTTKFEAWLTGFWEGDGTTGGKTITFYQKNIPMLLDIAEGIECGHVSWSGTGMGYLGFSREQSRELVEVFSRYLVCQKRLVQLQDHGFLVGGLHQPTKEWFTGFWDAEGFSYSAGRDCSTLIGIEQKDKSVLEGIKGLWGAGRVRGWSWRIRGTDSRFQEIADLLLESSRNRRKVIKLAADTGLDFPAVVKAS